MTIDYDKLTALLASSHAAAAVRALADEAEQVGLGPELRQALYQALDDSREEAQTIQEASLRQAFHGLEALGRGRKREAFEAFAAYVNTVSDLAVQRDAIAESEAFLLSARDENGAFIVSNPRVIEHVRKLGGMVDQMADRYLSDPQAWSRVLAPASKDLCAMAAAVRFTVPGEFENPYHRFRALTERTQELALAVRASKILSREEAKSIEALSFDINLALEEGCFHDLIQIALEVWVRSVETLPPYEGIAADAVARRGVLHLVNGDSETRNTGVVKLAGVREGAPSTLRPATVPTLVNTGAIPTGTTITTALALGAIHPCTRVLK